MAYQKLNLSAKKKPTGNKAAKNAAPFISPTLQRKCEKCDEEEKVQKKADGQTTTAQVQTSQFISSLQGKGTTLPPTQQQFFGRRMAHDFSQVHIHTGPDADASAREMKALAYATGNHIVFRQGQFNPHTAAGRLLLAHELAHVKQQHDGLMLKTDPAATEEKMQALPNNPQLIQGPVKEENTTHYGNCAGVSVQGVTNANYRHRFTATANPQPATGCSGCEAGSCISSSGTITSIFTASPTVSLPAVPGGLNECETAAVQNFINTTLRAHENEHVTAFNTYAGTVVTAYTYSGCRSGLDAYMAGIHAGIESSRRAASDAESAGLDPFNEPIPCQCPDPEPDPAPEAETEAE